MAKNIFKNITSVIIVSVLILSGCKTPCSCLDNTAEGNPGCAVNSSEDDFMPFFKGDTLLYLRTGKDKNNSDFIIFSRLKKKGFSQSKEADFPPYKDLKVNSKIYQTSIGKNPAYIYSAYDKKMNSDILLLQSSKKPVNISKTINTGNFDAQPAMSADGGVMVFSSDREGGRGETDLYVTYLTPSGEWTAPQNLGNFINTPQHEISPFISDNGDLYYASDGFNTTGNFDILKAESDGKGKWKSPVLLKPPVNSDSDDIDPYIHGAKIYLSSNRESGCGGFDIYSFDRCKPVFLTIKLADSSKPKLSIGTIEIIDENNKNVFRTPFEYPYIENLSLEPGQSYKVIYKSKCFTGFSTEKIIPVPCSDTSIIKINLEITGPETDFRLDLTSFDIPFFVSGYYIPNTRKNLEDLRLKFDYNLIGQSDSTRYIERPDSKYDEYAPEVEKALDEARLFILKKLPLLDNSCKPEAKLYIYVNGYADPRPISENAKYAGFNIEDAEHSVLIEEGEDITNELLSTLRAYYTFLSLQKELILREEYINASDRIVWKINGCGIDENSGTGDARKRRVSFSIELK